MTNSLTVGKRALSIAVAAATILWAVGFAAFVAPLTAQAAVAGNVIKGTTLSTLYYYGGDGNRYAFPNEKTYFSWYSDFSGVVTMSDSELAAIPLAGNIVYRPGSRWIKIQSDPKTYAVTPNGSIRWIESEAVAQGLAGSQWNTMIDDVPDVFFVDYTVGSSLTSAAAGYNGALVSSAGSNYLIWNGQKQLVTSAGFSANRYQTRFVLSGTGVTLNTLTSGADITSAVAAYTDTAQKGGVSAPTGGLNVSLASDTPAAMTIPSSARGVAFSKFKLMAASGNATVDQLTVSLGGIGATTNVENAYLYEGSARLTSARTVNSTTRQATFSGLGFALTSGQTRFLTVKGDVALNASGGATASFGIAKAGDISSTATVSGTFPANGNTMTFSTTDVGYITIDKEGSISNPTIGEEGAVISRFKIAASTEDATLNSLTLHVNDAKDHKNFMLYEGSNLLATGTNSSGDLVDFVFTKPMIIADGETKHFKLQADIGGQDADTIQVAVEEDADVIATGGDYGFNMCVDQGDTACSGSAAGTYNAEGSACTSASVNCSYSTIQGGKLTIAFNGPQSSNIQVDGKDVTLLKFSVTSENWTEIKDFDIIIQARTGSGAEDANDDNGGLVRGDGTEANLKDFNIRIASTGKVWMGPLELSSLSTDATDVSQVLDFSDDQVMNAGDSLDLILTADVDNNTPANEEYRAVIDVSGIAGEDANGDALATTDIVPGSDITGNVFTAVSSALTVAASAPPSGGTYVKGAQNVPVVGFAFTAGEASAVTVTDLTQTVLAYQQGTDTTWNSGTPTAVTETDKINSCSLYDNETGGLVDGPESLNTSNALLFQNFRWTVPAGETNKLLTKCNFANVAPDDVTGTPQGDEYAVYISANTDVTAEDAEGDSIASPTLSVSNSTAAVSRIIIANAGTLTVAVDGATPKSTIILGSSTGVEVSRFKFTASNEAFTVDEITLWNCQTMDTTSGDDTECTATGSDAIAAAVKVEYQNQAGETVTHTGALTGGYVQFDGMSLYVPTTTSAILKVYVDTSTVSSTGATSGNWLGLHLFGDDDSTNTEFTAFGVASGTSVTEADTAGGSGSVVMCTTTEACAANAMQIRKTKPTFSLASGSPSGAGIPGLSEVLRFNVAADSRGFVVLNSVAFKVTSSAATTGWEQCDGGSDIGSATKWAVYDAEDTSTAIDDAGDWATTGGFAEADGSPCDSGDALAYAMLDFDSAAGATAAPEIAAGTTKTFIVKLDTTGASSANDDSIRVDITDEATIDALSGTIGANTWLTKTVAWEDDSENSAADIDGTYIKNLPVTGGTIIY